MSGARIASGQDGDIRVSGELTFATVPAALRASEAQFATAARWHIDLSEVTATDSAGLSLLIEWFRWAERDRKSICFVGAPAQLRALAKISDIDRLLPFDAA